MHCTSFITLFTGSDFLEVYFVLLVPKTRNEHGPLSTFQLPIYIVPFITNDNINENEQSFVLVAQVIEDTLEDAVCFMRHGRDSECHGNVGATLLINIIDDDGKCDHNNNAVSHFVFCS